MTTPDFVVLIPARMASQRLPNKPLLDIGGKPMIVRVAQQAPRARRPVSPLPLTIRRSCVHALIAVLRRC